MKILHLSTSRNGGAGRAAFRIHNALRLSGVDSKFTALDEITKSLSLSDKLKTNLTEKIKWRLKNHFGIYLSPKEKLQEELTALRSNLDCEIASLPFYSRRISQLSEFEQADIINLHWVAERFDYQDFFNHVSKPIVWTFHDMNPIQGLFHYRQDQLRNKEAAAFDQRIKKFKRKQIKRVGKNLRVVCPSQWLKEEVIKSGLVKQEYVSIIPYPLDLGIFKPNDTSTRDELGIPNEILFLAVADYTWVHRKGFDLLREALSKLDNVRLILIGSKHEDATMQDNVTYTGKIKDNHYLSQLYAAADATIIPSREDNLPNVMLESLACGTPVISFKVGGMLDHVHDLITGILANEISSYSLASAIQKFLDNKEKFKSSVIRKYAEDHFNEKNIASKYENLYKRMLQL